MLKFLVRLIKWTNANKYIAIGLFIILPILSFYLHLYHNASPHTISLLLFGTFIARIIVSIIVSIYILSFWKPPNKTKISCILDFQNLNWILYYLNTIHYYTKQSLDL